MSEKSRRVLISILVLLLIACLCLGALGLVWVGVYFVA